MVFRGFKGLIGVSLVLILAIGNAAAQQTVYKWVDQDGVVHFGESPPTGVEAERITTSAAPRSVPTQATPPAPAPESKQPASEQPKVAKTASPPTVPATPIAEMSLAELDRRCDAAREAKIAPLRAAEIERCKADPRNDPAFCERHNADFGEGGRNVNGTMRPRMFDDLPACVEAQQERNRRPR